MFICTEPSPVTQQTTHRVGKLGPMAAGNAKAHGAETARVDPLARFGKRVVEGGKHLVLAHVGGDERLPLGHLVESLDDLLRLDQGWDGFRRPGSCGSATG